MDLTRVLKGYRPGRWVVLNGARTRVVASGSDAAEALARAAKKRTKADGEILLLRVMDPNIVHIF